MRVLSGDEERIALEFIVRSAELASLATCERSRCGSVIVYEGVVIGEGCNSPPRGLESQRRCSTAKTSYDSKVTDKTCCVHAEQRAIMAALMINPEKIRGSRLYFVRLDADGNMSRADSPYCTICSKMALDAGVSEFVLWHKEGVTVYNTEEYNDMSFRYRGQE